VPTTCAESRLSSRFNCRNLALRVLSISEGLFGFRGVECGLVLGMSVAMRLGPFRLCTSAPQDIRQCCERAKHFGMWDTCAWVVYHRDVEYVNSYFWVFGSDNVYYVQFGRGAIGVGSIEGRGWPIGGWIGVVEGTAYGMTVAVVCVKCERNWFSYHLANLTAMTSPAAGTPRAAYQRFSKSHGWLDS